MAHKPIVVEKIVEKIKHVHIDDESDKLDDAQIPKDERGFYKIFKHLQTNPLSLPEGDNSKTDNNVTTSD